MDSGGIPRAREMISADPLGDFFSQLVGAFTITMYSFSGNMLCSVVSALSLGRQSSCIAITSKFEGKLSRNWCLPSGVFPLRPLTLMVISLKG